ncbi:MAG: methyltransferase [Chloroflexota bacterium]
MKLTGGCHGCGEPAARPCADCAARVATLRRIAADPPPYPGGEGAGVLTCGGGRYWPGVVVLARMLRDTGSTLPVQCWYRGSVEEVRPADVAGLGVELIDVEQFEEWNARPRFGAGKLIGNAAVDKDGWRVKLFALARARFESVLYLDADAYPVQNPAPFLDLAAAHGFAFWEDLSDASAAWWPKVWPGGGAGTAPIQGGQLAIHRPSVWREIALAAEMNRDAPHYYQRVHGDQDTWRVAFAVTGRRPLNLGKAPWKEVAFVCPLDGDPLIVHRIRTKLFRMADVKNGAGEAHSKPHPHLPAEDRAFAHFAAAVADERPGEVFPLIYSRQLWGKGSGAGSSAGEAAPYVEWVNGEAARRGWRTATDAGCGDGRVAARLEFEEYHGVDVVPAVIEANRRAMPRRAWTVADITDPANLPAADVLLCKDVLHHWPNATVLAWLAAVVAAGKWRALVVCVDTAHATDGGDCPLGSYRALAPHLEPLKPFGLTTAREFLHKSILVLDLPATG